MANNFAQQFEHSSKGIPLFLARRWDSEVLWWMSPFGVILECEVMQVCEMLLSPFYTLKVKEQKVHVIY